MNTAFLIIGSNTGNRAQYLSEAINKLQKLGNVIQTSSIYETQAWGVLNQSDYYNQVIVLITYLQADDLMKAILSIEKNMGRTRSVKYAARNIDIDILFFNDEIIDTLLVTVPHPHIAARRFVLMPMAEIAPDLSHPVLHKPITALLATCPDNLRVEKLDISPR